MANVTLTITKSENQPGHYHVVVDGEGFFNSVGKKVGARIRGDDEFFDDSLFGIGGVFETVQIGGTFKLVKTVSGGQLNEDWGRDEIYALVDIEGVDKTFKSNKVTGNF